MPDRARSTGDRVALRPLAGAWCRSRLAHIAQHFYFPNFGILRVSPHAGPGDGAFQLLTPPGVALLFSARVQPCIRPPWGVVLRRIICSAMATSSPFDAELSSVVSWSR